MKNLFGINKENEKIDGIVYLDRELPQELKESIENVTDQSTEMQKKVSIPTWLRIVQYILIGFGLIVVISFANVSAEKGRDVAWSNGKELFITGVISLLVGAGIFVYSRIKSKIGVSQEEVNEFESNANDLLVQCKTELNIPDDAKHIDVMVFTYDGENGKPKKMMGVQYMAMDATVFNEDDSLCIADVETVLKIPHSEILRIEKIKKKITFAGWNKPEPPKKNRYNGCKVLVQNGVFITTKAYEVIIESTFGSFNFIVPEYEKDILKELLNVEIIEEVE